MNENQALIIGLLEFDGSMNPAVIVGGDLLAVAQEALRQVQFTREDGRVALAVEDYGWLEANPFPPTDDASAILAWFTELHDSDEIGDDFHLTIYIPPTSPNQMPATLAGVLRPHAPEWHLAR